MIKKYLIFEILLFTVIISACGNDVTQPANVSIASKDVNSGYEPKGYHGPIQGTIITEREPTEYADTFISAVGGIKFQFRIPETNEIVKTDLPPEALVQIEKLYQLKLAAMDSEKQIEQKLDRMESPKDLTPLLKNDKQLLTEVSKIEQVLAATEINAPHQKRKCLREKKTR